MLKKTVSLMVISLFASSTFATNLIGSHTASPVLATINLHKPVDHHHTFSQQFAQSAHKKHQMKKKAPRKPVHKESKDEDGDGDKQ